MNKIILAVTFLLTMCTTAMAQTNTFAGPYAGLSLGYSSFKSDAFNEKINGLSYGAFGGFRAPVSDNVVVGVEGFLDFNQGNKAIPVGGGLTETLNINELGGGALTAGIVMDKTLVYALAGYGWLNVSNETLDISDNAGGIRLGVGAEFKATENIGVRLQTVWQNFDGASLINGGVGIVFQF